MRKSSLDGRLSGDFTDLYGNIELIKSNEVCACLRYRDDGADESI